MKKLLKVLINILFFGVPLFVDVLIKKRKLIDMANEGLVVTADLDKQSVSIKLDKSQLSMDLNIDHVVTTQPEEVQLCGKQ